MKTKYPILKDGKLYYGFIQNIGADYHTKTQLAHLGCHIPDQVIKNPKAYCFCRGNTSYCDIFYSPNVDWGKSSNSEEEYRKDRKEMKAKNKNVKVAALSPQDQKLLATLLEQQNKTERKI